MKLNFDSGFLIIADISGYTSYVAKTELQDAQALLAELLTRIVEQFKSVVKISRLEGDAVFAYSSSSIPLRGETLMELIESTYIAFREGQEVYRRTLCDCEACLSLPMLELKFIIHHGEYAMQKVGDYRELIGSDVNLVHRLLKNHVTEATGWQAYALITQSALTQMKLSLDGVRQQTEGYDHLGEINTHLVDLLPRYQAWVESRRVVVTSQEADLTMNAITDLPPHEVWNYLNDPSSRIKWETIENIREPDERPAIGRQSLCVEGNKTFTEVLLDWKPFDYYSVARVLPYGNKKGIGVQALTTFKLNPTANGGTNLQIYCKVRSTLPTWAMRFIARYILRYMKIEPAYLNLSKLLTRIAETNH
jgi:class 3 adenylate cyclase